MKHLKCLLCGIFFALPVYASKYYDSLKPEDKIFFSAHFTLDDLYGDQNHQSVQKLCALIASEDEKNQMLTNWSRFRQEKNAPEDTIGTLSHHLRASLLRNTHFSNFPWITASLEIQFQTRLHGLDFTKDSAFRAFASQLDAFSSWSPEQDLPFDALGKIHPHATRLFHIKNFDLLRARSYQKSVTWYLKTYQTYVDILETTAAFYQIPHTAKTPRSLIPKKSSNSYAAYFSIFATIGRTIAEIFKARIHFFKSHAPEIDTLLKMGFITSEQGFSIPPAKLDEKWHDLRPVGYYFKSEADEPDPMKPLFMAMPHLLDSKQTLQRKQLPLTSFTVQLRRLVQAYHAIKKKDKSRLEDRITLLAQICDAAEQLFQDTSFHCTITPLELEHLQELKTTAQNKLAYLNQLKVTLVSEERRRNLIPQDPTSTTREEIRGSLKLSEIYEDLDPEYRSLPYLYAYSTLKEGSYIFFDLKLQKVAPFLEVDEDEFLRAEEEGNFHNALNEQVDQIFALKFPNLEKGKELPSYFLWLENKNTLHIERNLRHAVPQSDMLLEVYDEKAFNKIFASPEHSIILDGVYLYSIPEDGKIYIFPGDRSENLASKEENQRLHDIARRRYGVNFDEFSTRTIHPLLCKGSNVFTAGEIKFKDGKITHINNNSGHYVPFAFHLLNGLNRLLPAYRTLYAPDATVGCRSQPSLPYGEFMSLDITVLKNAF